MPVMIQGSVGLNAANNAADVIVIKKQLIARGFDWLSADDVVGPMTIKTIRLFQAIKNGFNRVNDERNDGRIDPQGDTLRWLNAINTPRWMVMPAGAKKQGFINDELAQISDRHDFGTSWLAEAIRSAAATYRENYLHTHPNAALIHINDISLPTGGDTPMHATHEAGLCCDLRLPRKDGSVGGITTNHPQYDRAAMKAMIRALRKEKTFSRLLLSDDVLVAQGLCIAASGHHNHAHFEIKPPVREMPA